jgi:hypothetical protein
VFVMTYRLAEFVGFLARLAGGGLGGHFAIIGCFGSA